MDCEISLLDPNCFCAEVIDVTSSQVVSILIPGPPGPTGVNTSKTITSDYTPISTDGFIAVNSAANVNITLPDPTTLPDVEFDFINIGTGTVTLVGTVSGAVNFVINRQYDSVSIKSVGGQWLVW